MPAVSTSRISPPESKRRTSTKSLVVPGIELTNKRSSSRRALIRLDLPALGAP